MERIAEALNVSHQTIGRDPGDLVHHGQIKTRQDRHQSQRCTGRPKGSTKPRAELTTSLSPRVVTAAGASRSRRSFVAALRRRKKKGPAAAWPAPVFRNAKQIPKRAKQAPAGEPHKNTLRPRPQSRTTTDRRSARSALSDVTYPVTYDLAKAGPLNSADIAMNTKPATETPNQREFLLSQLSPPERQTVESILADYPGLTVAMCIEQLRNAGWL